MRYKSSKELSPWKSFYEIVLKDIQFSQDFKTLRLNLLALESLQSNDSEVKQTKALRDKLYSMFDSELSK